MDEQHMNGLQLSREQWMNMTPENRDLTLYNAVVKSACQPPICNKQFKKIYGFLIVIGVLMVTVVLDKLPGWVKVAVAFIP